MLIDIRWLSALLHRRKAAHSAASAF